MNVIDAFRANINAVDGRCDHLATAAFDFENSSPGQDLLSGVLMALLDRLNVGVVVMTVDAEVVVSNRRAGELLTGTPIDISARRLRVDGMLSAKLRRTIELAASSDVRPPPMSITLQDGARLMMILAERTRGLEADRPLVVLWLFDFAGGLPDCAWMRDAFNFTSAEQCVVEKLALGLAPEQIAEASGNSVATIRSHLQRAYAKSNAGGQAKLVRMAHLLPLVPGG